MTSPTLPPRYEIRQLEPEHTDWALAIFAHSNVFHSPAFTVLYPHRLGPRCLAAFRASRGLVRHQIDSGHSLGVFDTHWQPRHPSLSSPQGKLLWDLDSDDGDVDGAALASQMDFPLASIALAYDSFDPPDEGKVEPLREALPAVRAMYAELERRDGRDAAAWRAGGPGEVLFRNGTSTHRAYEGRGLMKALAHRLMRRAAERGFRAIQIEVANDAVIHVWSNPPPPYRSELVSEIDPDTYEEVDGQGKRVFPLRPSKQRLQKIWVDLK